MNTKYIAMIVLAGLAAVFFIQNAAVVELRFLFWTLSMSGALSMFLILLVGAMLGWWLRGTFIRRKRNSHAEQTNIIAE